MLTNKSIRANKVSVDASSIPLDEETPRTSFPARLDWKAQYGIDCVDMVHFHHWEPGGEYVKNITIKNVVMKTQKIRYKLPQTRYFSMEFPETQTLSAGMNWTIPVTFRPVAKESYDDVIEISTSFGVLKLPIKASLPEHVMEFPDTIDFGYCPIKETAKINFKLQNTGELTSFYEWSIEPPFFISPDCGQLEPGKSCSVLIEFKPKEANVISAVALCSFGLKEQWERTKAVKATKIHAISKYSHLIIDGEKTFDFGNVYVGSSVEKSIFLRNPSAVHANFKIKRAEKDNETCFDFSAISGRLEKQSTFEIKIKCTPVAAGLHSNAYFDITTLSGNTIRIVASASGIGPKVSLEPSLLNFNDVLAGNDVIRIFNLRNDSNISANYQFLTEKNSTFKIDKLYGTIGPNSVISLQVKMDPIEPMNYYRRVYCLVENQDTIHIDFLGTCYNDKRRPATFEPKHLFNYQTRVKNGLVEYGPEQLEELIKNGILRSKAGALEYADPIIARENALKLSKDEPNSTGYITSEFFYSNSGALACSLLDTYVDFGSCSRYRVIETRTVRVANNTKGKMTCVWIEEEDANGEALFSVSPKIADIPSKSIYEFKVHFRPKVDSEFYGKQLECFCYFKSMRNFRLVNEDTFTPPWCLTPEVAGNTFPPGEDTFIPKTDFGRNTVVFPPCSIDRSEYQIIKISNAGDTTVKFSFLDNYNGGIGGDTELSYKGGPVFSIKPRVGVLKKNESRLIALRFSPGEKKHFEEAFTCHFNNSVHTKYDLNLRGFGAFPEIAFESDNRLHFKPTCIGAIESRTFPIRNKSKASLFFEWQIPRQLTNVIAIQPMSGFLQADQMMPLQCTFSPPAASKYILNVPCYYFHDEKRPEKQRTTLSIYGIGVYGKLSSSPEQLDFTNILINTCVEKEITLFNPSECDIIFTIGIKKIIRNKDGSASYEILKNDLQESQIEVCQKTKILPARSNESIKVKACLKTLDKSAQEFLIYYSTDKFQLGKDQGTSSQNASSESEHFPLTSIIAKGVHPILLVPDIRSDGVSKTLLWQLFSLRRFNNLLAEPTDDPLAYVDQGLENDSFPTDTVIDCSPIEADVNFDFGATSVGSDPMLVKLSLKNSGVVPVDWSFNFPNDTDVEIERWADPGDITEEQITRNFILDNRVFEISPKCGKLEPNQTVTILLTYLHEFLGPHRLPVLFRLRNGVSRAGKEILINFIGYSVPPTQKFLHLQSINHEFDPVYVGTKNAPIQYYRMMNRGTAALEYSIDTSSIVQFNKENMNFPILKCLKTKGVILPGEMDFLHFIFCPLEEKEYELDLAITVDKGKTRIITLRGRGMGIQQPFDSPVLLDPKISNQIAPFPTLPPLVNPVARLSLERIDFGNIPVSTILRQVVVVTNSTPADQITINWNIPGVWPSGSILISPMSKKLLPGESQVFKIIFEPDECPRLYNFDIECHVTNDTKVEKYHSENKALSPVELLELNEEKKLSKTILNVENSSTNTLSKYKKLPSISALEQPQSGDQASTPTIYFVGIAAQSHKVEEFRNTYEGYEKFYKKKRTGFSTVTNEKLREDIFQIKDLIESTMFSVLNEAILDRTVQNLLKDITKEDVPYYREQNIGKQEEIDENGISTSQIFRSADFINDVELALEGTLYNLMQEIDRKEFDPTTYPLLVSKPEFLAAKTEKLKIQDLEKERDQ